MDYGARQKKVMISWKIPSSARADASKFGDGTNSARLFKTIFGILGHIDVMIRGYYPVSILIRINWFKRLTMMHFS